MSVVVGREDELDLIDAVLRGGDGAAALALVGEPGIGKTTVWAAGVDRARASGSQVLLAQPAASESELSFAGLSDLVASVSDEVLAGLPAPQRAGLDAALLRTQASRAPGRRVVAAAFLSVLRALAAERPVVVAVDDLQWLDAPSAAVLEFALRRVQSEPVTVLATVRAGADGGDALPMLERALQARTIELRPLSVAALHRIVAATLGRSLSRPSIVRIAQASGGNPLYALEIAQQLGLDGGGGTLPVPETLDALVRRRVRSLPPETRDALLRAAALARPSTSVIDAGDLAAAEVEQLVRIEPDGRIQFVHPLFAAAVYSGAPLAHRRSVHRGLAGVVDDPEERARHLALAADAADDELLGELAAAAQSARGRGAPDSAAALTELALRLLPVESADGLRLRLELAEHLFLASDFARARAVLHELLALLQPGDLRARALLVLAEVDYWRAGESTALALTEEALASATDLHVRARCLSQIAMYAGTVDLPKAAAAAREALELLDGAGDVDPAVVSAALGARVRADLFLGNGLDRAAAERALALEADAPPVVVDGRAAFRLGQWLRYVDDFDGARACLSDVERQARDEGDDSSLANILLNRLILETWAGDWAEAETLTTRMVEAFAQQGVEAGGIGPWRVYLDAYAGRLEAVRAGVGPRPDEPVIAAIWDRCVGLAELAAGDVEAADRRFAEAISGLDGVDFREPAIWRVDGDAIEAAAGAGDLGRADAWTRRLEERAARSRIPWSLAVAARSRGLIHAAAGSLDDAVEALAASLDEHVRCPMPFEHARTLLVHGRVLRRLKRKRESRDSLERARAIFEGLGAIPWVDRANAELRRVAVRRTSEQITPTELRIAELAASGLSNPEIARQAFVSRKTVEANLARVYRKLGISSRAQLDRALRETDAPTS